MVQIVGVDVFPSVVSKNSIFRYKTRRSMLRVKENFGGIRGLYLQDLLAACFMLVPCLAYSSFLWMEVIFFLETSVAFQNNSWCHIPGDRAVQGSAQNSSAK
jgi:hypothetical protein